MPCLCQYFAIERALRVKALAADVKDNDHVKKSSEKGEVITGEFTTPELVICKGEIQSLKREISCYRISNENMELLMKKMIEEQHFLMTEIFELKKTNEDMRSQQVNDRNNQALERSTLLRELQEIKIHLRERSNVVEKLLQQNDELACALRDANRKIYLMGMKYLKLQGCRRSSSSLSANSTDRKEDTETNTIDDEFNSSE